MKPTKKPNNTPMSLTLMRLMFQVLTPIVPGLMNRYAYNLWITPLRIKAPEREQIVADQAKASYITADGLNIRVWSWGEGPTVLFIHGWGGRGTQISCFVDGLTKAGYKVMSFDMPAHGQSEGKRTNAFNVTKALTEVINQIDNLHTVITHSFAGIIFGYYYNAQLPLKNAIMICPPATLSTAFNQFVEMLNLPQSVQAYILKQLKENFGDDVFEKLSLIHNASKITQPVLVVHDKDDDIVPYQDGIDISNALKQGTFYETQELGHRKVLYDDTVIERVLKFVSTNT